MKGRVAYGPRDEIVIVDAGPPGVIVPVLSGGTLNNDIVAFPVASSCGSTRIVYVPATTGWTSMNPPNVPMLVGLTRLVDPSGFTIDTFVEQQAEEPIVTLLT